jgi:hypothetical protein
MNSNSKTIIVVVILLIVIILSGSLALYYLGRSSGQLELLVNSASISVENKEWTSAQKQLDEFEKNWVKTRPYWSMLVDHFEIDHIEDSYEKAKKYVETQEYPSSLAELESLKHYILHIPRKEGFTMQNIF